MTIHAESEKVLNVPSILRVTVLMFFNVEYLRGDVFLLWNLLTVIDLNSMVKYSIDLIPYEDPQTTSNLMWITEFWVKFIKMFLNIRNFLDIKDSEDTSFFKLCICVKQAFTEQGNTRSFSSKICLITSFGWARPRSCSQLSAHIAFGDNGLH